MNINVSVANQQLKIATNLRNLIAGTQEFIYFVFKLPSDWNGLRTFAQFIQNEQAYNVYLDEDNKAALPPEIGVGTVTLMLYGVGGNTRATTNYLTLSIGPNILVENAQSTEISQSLYTQLVNIVNNYTMSTDTLTALINTKANQSALAQEVARAKATEGELSTALDSKATQTDLSSLEDRVEDLENNPVSSEEVATAVQAEIAAYLASGTLANLTIEDGSLTRDKVNSDFEATLAKADSAMQPSVYNPNNYTSDPYSFAQAQDIILRTAIFNTTSIPVTDTVQDSQITNYTGLVAALNGVLTKAKTYTNAAFDNYSPFDISIVEELPETGAERTFYLIPKESGNGYEKYWWIIDEDNNPTWDNFGASSTVVVDVLPAIGEPDVDYILSANGEYQYYKFINNTWALIAGSNAEVFSFNKNPIALDTGVPSEAGYDANLYEIGDIYIDTETFTKYIVIQTDGAETFEWSQDAALIAVPSLYKDYYVQSPNGTYAHYRYVSKYDSSSQAGVIYGFFRIGSDAYTRTQIDEIVQSAVDTLNADISDIQSDVSELQTTLNNLANMVVDVTINGTKDNVTVTYADGSTTNFDLDKGIDIDTTAYNVDGDHTLHFYDSNGEELQDLAVEITGGGGGGSETSGNVTIGRITPATVQTIYGDEYTINYTVIATDSSGEGVGSGIGTLYVNNIIVENGFTVFTSTFGAENSIDIGQYLAVGTNAVKISVSVDTGGETNKVSTKTWSVNAINMYLEWNYTDNQVNTSAVTDYYTPYGALNKTIYSFIDVDPIGFNPEIVTELPDTTAQDFDPNEVMGINYFLYSNDEYAHYIWDEDNSAFAIAQGRVLDVTTTTRSGVQQALTIPIQTHGSHIVARYMVGVVNGATIKTAVQVHDMIFVTAGETDPVIAVSFNTAKMTQYNTVSVPIVVYDPAGPTTNVSLSEDGIVVSTWTSVDRTVHYWNYSPTNYGTKTLTITCKGVSKSISIEVENLDISEEEVSGYDFRFKASEMATNDAVRNWSASYLPVGTSTPQTVDITFSPNFDWINGGLHTEYDEDGHLRQYFAVRAGTTATFNYNLFGNAYDPKEYGKSFKFIFKAVNCRTYDANVLTCMDNTAGNNGVGLVMTANEATFTSVNNSIKTYYCKDNYIEFEINIHPISEYRYLQFWMDGSHDVNKLYDAGDGMQQITPVGITVGSPNCDVYIYMMKAYPTYLSNNNELSNFIMDAPNAYEMVNRYNRNDILNESGEVDYQKLAAANPDLHIVAMDMNRMTTGKKDNAVAYTVRHIFNRGGDSSCFTVNNVQVTVQGTSSVGYLESAGNVDLNFKYNRTFTSDNESYTTGSILFDDGTTSTKGFSMTENSIPVDYLNIKVNVASSENANNACNADWYNTYQPWLSPARAKNPKARDTIEFVPGAIFIRDRSGNLFGGDTSGYHFYGICDIGNSKKNTKVMHDTTNPLAVCVEVANNTSLPCLMSSRDYTWNSDYEAVVVENNEEQKVYEFRYVKDGMEPLGMNAWDRFVKFMTDYNPNLATNNPIPETTFGNYTFKGSGSYDTGSYDSEEYDVVYLYGYGLPSEYNNGIYSASNYQTDTTGNNACYYYINYSNNHIYSSNGTVWTDIGELTWTADRNNVLAGTSIGTYAGTYTTDSYEYRMAYLLEHCEEYMIMDPVMFHFILIESFLLTDNVAKNTFWSSDDLVHWELSKAYDMDTSHGNDNVGGLSFTYGLETDDTVGSSYVFNAHDASWITFCRGLFGAAQTMYRNRESAGCFNTENYLAKVKNWQSTRPERLWVADAQRKYLRPYEDNGTETYLPMLAGKKTHQRAQVKTYNAYYYASKYVSDLCTSQNIMVRGNTPTTWTGVAPANTATLSMYINCYIVVASTSYNVVAKTKATRGQSYVMDFSTIGSMGETELYFCTAPMITELSGLAHLYFKQNNFAMGTNLQRLEIGSAVEGYTNPNLESLTIGNNKMLEYLDVRNCPNATGALDLSGCVSLADVYLENTGFTGIEFATGGLLQTAHLPMPTVLTMRQLIYVNDLSLESASRLQTLTVEDCTFGPSATLTIAGVTTVQENIDTIISLVNTANALSRIRLVGIDWTLSSTDLLERLRRMAGKNDSGYDISQSVLTGDAYVPTMRQSYLARYNSIWPYLDISYDAMVTQYEATFLNADGNPILDKNGNAYIQYVDAGSLPYDPITMGYTISVRDNGSPTVMGYAPEEYSGLYYLDTREGVVYESNGTTWSVVEYSDILAPTMADTAQYIYTFTGWYDITTLMYGARTITAQYTSEERTYRVRYFRDPATILRIIENVPYGGSTVYGPSDVIVGYAPTTPGAAGYSASNYSGKYFQDTSTGFVYYSNGTAWAIDQYDPVFPEYTDDESRLVFRLPHGWDKNTGYITGDTDVYMTWLQTDSALPQVGTEMNEMTLAEISGIAKSGLQDNYFEACDYFDFSLGHDFNFTNVDSITIGPKFYNDSNEDILTLPDITIDKYVSGGYYFDGSSAYETDISLFGENSPSFTMAIDFDFIGTTNQSTLVSANYGATENFRLAYVGGNPTIFWGDKSIQVGFAKTRDIVVIRHVKGSNSIYVYSGGYSNATSTRIAPTINKTTLTRVTDMTNEIITLGARNYHTSTNQFRDYGTGHIHWMKIWYDDIGETNAYALATWTHEKSRVDYWGKNKYEYSDGSGNLTDMTFLWNNCLAKTYWMNSTNVNTGGWNDSLMRELCNDRIYKAFPYELKSMIKQVQINATAGNQSTNIVRSDDYVYLLSSHEQNGYTGNGYDSEIGADSSESKIPWFVAQAETSTVSSRNTLNAQRLKWLGRIRTYALGDGNTTAYDGTPYIYYSTDDPAATFSTNIAPGSIWLDSNDSSRGYYFVSQEELDQYGITPAYTASSVYASGGWVVANSWWSRSSSVTNSANFAHVNGIGNYYYNNATNLYGVVPSFSI